MWPPLSSWRSGTRLTVRWSDGGTPTARVRCQLRPGASAKAVGGVIWPRSPRGRPPRCGCWPRTGSGVSRRCSRSPARPAWGRRSWATRTVSSTSCAGGNSTGYSPRIITTACRSPGAGRSSGCCESKTPNPPAQQTRPANDRLPVRRAAYPASRVNCAAGRVFCAENRTVCKADPGRVAYASFFLSHFFGRSQLAVMAGSDGGAGCSSTPSPLERSRPAGTSPAGRTRPRRTCRFSAPAVQCQA